MLPESAGLRPDSLSAMESASTVTTVKRDRTSGVRTIVPDRVWRCRWSQNRRMSFDGTTRICTAYQKAPAKTRHRAMQRRRARESFPRVR